MNESLFVSDYGNIKYIEQKKNILESAAVTLIEWAVGIDLAKLHFWQSWYIII